ncbi:MAG: MarR family transcriptional regulator, partial [Anaerolineales bacterium]|nr:MarR family transcriptional regulator [Anaerolineales bacterium]
SVALWVWIAAAPIEREVVFLATTIALVIALVLVVNVVVLMIFRLQKRISHLEGEISQNDAPSQETLEEQVIVVTLTNTERRIINRLEENEGRLTQDELRRATGLSKSTLSVTLTTLERKSLVEREISGRTKIVTLKRRVSR